MGPRDDYVFQNPTNAVGGSFILSLQRRCRRPFSRIPPTQLVDRSHSAYIRGRASPLQNPTNAVGGSFILSLQRRCRRPFSRIPPTQLVDFILSLHSGSPSGVLNPTNAVGG